MVSIAHLLEHMFAEMMKMGLYPKKVLHLKHFVWLPCSLNLPYASSLTEDTSALRYLGIFECVMREGTQHSAQLAVSVRAREYTI